MLPIHVNAALRKQRVRSVRTILILLTFILLITTITPLPAIQSHAEAATPTKSDPIVRLLQETKSYMTRAKQLDQSNDQEGTYANVAKGEAKLLQAIQSKGASDPKYGALFATSGFSMSTVLHPTNTGVEFVRTFASNIPCDVAGCQGVPLSVVMMFKFTDGTTSTIRTHIVPLPGDTEEVNQFFIYVLKQYGLFRTSSGDIIMLNVLANWRGGGYSISLRNLSHGNRLESYTRLFNKSDLPGALLKQWDDSQKSFFGLCDEGEPTVNCTVEESEQTALKAIDEDAGTVTFGTKVIHLRNVSTVKSNTDRVKLRKFIDSLVKEGTFANIQIHPGEQIVAVPQLGEPLAKHDNMLLYRSFTLQTNAIGEVKHIYYSARTAGLQTMTLAWLENQLGTTAVNRGGSSALNVLVRSRYGLFRLTFTAPNRSSRVQTISLSGPLEADTRGIEISTAGST
ncbi:hypothetical protein H8B09_01625 [Paenibacillus sp. PR3]|uniref:Uncharacterized protein n=1 Tax=Paenibacillus terricola TaxID=2763503 RepID=A0ABR8MN41_9BACL|nr:hypothetical protein [Paenibacillus terricola]MBD3917438.1 hypothetical protein [Paenibacillus terricola]